MQVGQFYIPVKYWKLGKETDIWEKKEKFTSLLSKSPKVDISELMYQPHRVFTDLDSYLAIPHITIGLLPHNPRQLLELHPWHLH